MLSPCYLYSVDPTIANFVPVPLCRLGRLGRVSERGEDEPPDGLLVLGLALQHEGAVERQHGVHTLGRLRQLLLRDIT